MLNEYIGKNVVVDLSGQFVCVGVLQRIDPDYLELNDADFHDLRDSKTGRENYVVDSRLTGVKRNRKCVLLVRRECVAVSLLEDIVVE